MLPFLSQSAISPEQRQELKLWGPRNGSNQHAIHNHRSGRPTLVLVNRFPLELDESRGTFVHSYFINILPVMDGGGGTSAPPLPDQAASQRDRKALKKKVARLVLAQWVRLQGLPTSSYAFDGAHQLYLTSSVAPDQGETLVQVQEESRRLPSRFQVTHEKTNRHPIDLRVLLDPNSAHPDVLAAAFSVIDLIIKQSTVSLPGTEARGNSTYFLPSPIPPLLPPPSSSSSRPGPSSSSSYSYQERQKHVIPLKSIGKGAQVSSGFKAVVSKSMHQGRPGLSLSIDAVVTAAIPQQPMVSFICSFFGVSEEVLRREGLRNMPRKDLKAFAMEVRGMEAAMVQVEGRGSSQPPRCFSALELPRDLKNAREYTFPAKNLPPSSVALASKSVKGLEGGEGLEEPRMVSIADYFEEKYRCRLQFPLLPVMQVKPGKNCMIPPELLVIQPKLIKGKPDPDQTAQLVKEGALDPKRRKERILDIVNGESRLMESHTLQEFGIKLGSDPLTKGMERRSAHILPAPCLLMGNNLRLRPQDDGFLKVREDARFLRPALVESWVVYSHLPRQEVEEGFQSRVQPENSISRFVRDLRAQGQGRGLSFPDKSPPIVYRDDPELSEDGHNPTWARIIEHCRFKALAAYKRNASFIIVLLDGNGNSREYNACKEATLTVGLVSQCVSVGRAKLGSGGQDKGRRAYLSNLLLKVNAKLGGVNLALEGATWRPQPLRGQLVSVIGVDVNHDSEEQPSVAALVASVDEGATQYICEPLMQAGGQRREIIDRMKPAMRNILTRFAKANYGKLPQVLVVMRDGVGESQVPGLLDIECEQMKEACIELGAKDTLMIVITLEKRHNIRIFPDDRGRGRDDGEGDRDKTRNGNVLPGTIVEGLFTGHSLVDNPYLDFLLVSHAGSIGTVRGVRHTKVIDEVGLTPDEVHTMCYHLTFLMSRSMRSVSLPAALFYADLAAKLARCLLKYEGPDGSDSSLRRGGGYLARIERGGDNNDVAPDPGPGDLLPVAGVENDFYTMVKVHEAVQMKQYFV